MEAIHKFIENCMPSDTYATVHIRESSIIDPQPGYTYTPGSMMWINHSRAYQFTLNHLLPQLRPGGPRHVATIERLIKGIHEHLMQNVEPFYTRNPLEIGDYRQSRVFIGNREGTSPYVLKTAMNGFITSLVKDLDRVYSEDLSERELIAFALFHHNTFEYIHPFVDGNGRTGRLLYMAIAMAVGVNAPPHILSAHRYSYYDLIEGDTSARNKEGPFISSSYFG